MYPAAAQKLILASEQLSAAVLQSSPNSPSVDFELYTRSDAPQSHTSQSSGQPKTHSPSPLSLVGLSKQQPSHPPVRDLQWFLMAIAISTGSIPHWLAEEFRTYCSRLYGLTPDDRVFYMTCTALNKELTRCTQLTYLPDIRVHDLRHSHVSLCIELGYSIVLVAKRIGDTVPVVMRTYAHLYPNKQQELVSKLEAIGSPTSNNDDSDLMSLG